MNPMDLDSNNNNNNKNIGIFSISTQRSGHNAILKWIAHQFQRSLRHYNDVRVENLDKEEFCECTFLEGIPYTGDAIYALEKPFDLEKSETICNDVLPSDAYNVKKIIIIRDHYNFISSLARTKKVLVDGFLNWTELTNPSIVVRPSLKGWQKHQYDQQLKRLKRFVRHWKAIAKFAQSNSDYTVILYNKWVDDLEYRKHICKQLGCPNTAYVECEKQSTHGGVSSFTGRKLPKSKKSYTERWKFFRKLC